MIFFWDKNLPKTIPEALRTWKIPHDIKLYTERYPLSDSAPEGGDERWLKEVGQEGWIIITQDHSFHKNAAEMKAIEDYGIGCFYLWGSEAPKWEIARCFLRAYDRIVTTSKMAQRPFIYRISKSGTLTPQSLP